MPETPPWRPGMQGVPYESPIQPPSLADSAGRPTNGLKVMYSQGRSISPQFPRSGNGLIDSEKRSSALHIPRPGRLITSSVPD